MAKLIGFLQPTEPSKHPKDSLKIKFQIFTVLNNEFFFN